jgi:hypothetical protein
MLQLSRFGLFLMLFLIMRDSACPLYPSDVSPEVGRPISNLRWNNALELVDVGVELPGMDNVCISARNVAARL